MPKKAARTTKRKTTKKVAKKTTRKVSRKKATPVSAWDKQYTLKEQNKCMKDNPNLGTLILIFLVGFAAAMFFNIINNPRI